MSKTKILSLIITILIYGILIFYPTQSIVVEAPEYQNKILSEDLLNVNQILNSRTSQIIDESLSRYSKMTGFNGVVMIVKNGDLIYNKAFGYANSGRNKIPLSTEMPFQLASVSKQFTAAAIMKLKQDGLLDYNDNVSKYIPEFPYNDVTIKQLLNHTGGMFNYMYLLENQWDCEEKFATNDTLIKMISKSEMPLYFTPGKRFDYSNTGYAVLASVVEHISNKPFSDFMNDHFFNPLGMKNTYVSTGTNITENSVNGFFRYRRGLAPIEYTVHDGIVGDKGVYSTSWDMYKWDKSLYNNKILSEEVLEEAFNPTIIGKRKVVPYGYGFRLKEEDGQKVVYHNGVWEGFRINYYRYPETESTILVMNNCGFNISSLTSRIKSLMNEIENEEAETKFVITSILNGNKEEAQSAYNLAIEEDNFNQEKFDLIANYLWENRYFQFYEDFLSIVSN
ncbi:beta-lactamase family protein [Odoribacter sp. OttesenSCG-928-L07]|nr:beta-lactamase family protein [Odoribacter sp. OttesenSCG-928-L07]MDL2239779.1 beta-lactamase family protein [Bacteroidales bacterium OttesenSCG-928-L14]